MVSNTSTGCSPAKAVRMFRVTGTPLGLQRCLLISIWKPRSLEVLDESSHLHTESSQFSVDAIRDNNGLFELAARDKLWVVVNPDQLHRLVIDQEPQPSHDHCRCLFDTETFGHPGWSRDGRDLDDLLGWPVALFAHLRVEASSPFPLVTAVVLSGQSYCNWGRRTDKASLALPSLD
jgi:hypothetical protein